jgi:ankyrin repeat protein
MKRKISTYREEKSGNSCLHIAGEYGNIPMVDYILKQQLVYPDLRNKELNTPLMHTLKTSSSNNFEQTVLLMASNCG